MRSKQKIYLTLIISAIIIIAIFALVIFPIINDVKTLSSKFSEKASETISLEEKSGSYLKTIKEEYADLEEEIVKITNSFADPRKPIDFILAVEAVAAATNNFQQIKETTTKEDKTISFQVSLWGSFPNLVRFLGKLENMGYFVGVNSIQIARVNEQELVALNEREIDVAAGDIKSIVNIKIYSQ